MRKGSANTQKGMLRFCQKLAARVDRAGARGEELLRADSGSWNTKVFEYLEQIGWQYSIGARMIKKVRAAVEAIDEDAWQNIVYPAGGEWQIAETTYGERRLIVRRTRLVGAQAELFADWRYFAFITNRSHEIAVVEAEHRDHGVVEQVIADLKDQGTRALSLRRLRRQRRMDRPRRARAQPLRWTQLLGLPDTTIRAARTLRRRLIAVPGRLTRHARGRTLHLPTRSDARLTARHAHRPRSDRSARPPARTPLPANTPTRPTGPPPTHDHRAPPPPSGVPDRQTSRAAGRHRFSARQEGVLITVWFCPRNCVGMNERDAHAYDYEAADG
jgi:Transposase DDE domain group 1